MTDPIISQLKFHFNLKDDQIDAVNVWMGNNCRGTILYSTGTGKTEISFECARKSTCVVHRFGWIAKKKDFGPFVNQF